MTEEERIRAFKEHFATARQAVEAACVANDADRIRSSAEYLMLVSEDDEQYYYLGQFDEDFEAYERVMAKVPAALRSAGWSAADVIVWAYKMGSPPDRFSPRMAFKQVIDTPSGDYAHQEVWAEVAERLQSELKSFSDDQLESGVGAYQIEAIHVAWRRAGDESKALDLMMVFVPKIKNWKEVAEHLNKCGRYDDAILVAREGIKESALGDWCYPNDYAEELMEPLADAFSGKGDHRKAAAILAEQFLDWIGSYEYHRCVESFNKVLKEADLAGVGDETRDAIIHALKTGINPAPLVDWKTETPVQESEWRPVPKLVSYRAPDARDETPRWPLPRSNEGLKFSDLRWNTTEWFCQQDQEFLLRLALADGDKKEIVRRFDALPEFPRNSPTEDKSAMLNAVAAAVGDIRPDIAEKIRLRQIGTWR